MRRKIAHGTRIKVIQRDGPYCRYCGKTCEGFGYAYDKHGRLTIVAPGFAFDHVTPCQFGGLSVPPNLVFACESCNARKRDSVQVPTRVPAPMSLLPPTPDRIVQDRTTWYR